MLFPQRIVPAGEVFYPFKIQNSIWGDNTDGSIIQDVCYTGVPSEADARRKLTWATWLKRTGDLGVQSVFMVDYGNGNNQTAFLFQATGQLEFYNYVGGSYYTRLLTNAVFKDCSKWMHVCVRLDTTQAASTDRAKLWVNGVLQDHSTDLSVATVQGQNTTIACNYTGYYTAILRQTGSSSNAFSGNLAQTAFCYGGGANNGSPNGDPPDVSAFGEFKKGIWIPKRLKDSAALFGTKSTDLTIGAAWVNSPTWPMNSFSDDGDNQVTVGSTDTGGKICQFVPTSPGYFSFSGDVDIRLVYDYTINSGTTLNTMGFINTAGSVWASKYYIPPLREGTDIVQYIQNVNTNNNLFVLRFANVGNVTLKLKEMNIVDDYKFGMHGALLLYEDADNLDQDSAGTGFDGSSGIINVDASNQVADTPTNNYPTLDPNAAFYAFEKLVEGGLNAGEASALWHTALATFPLISGKWYFEMKKVNSSTDVYALQLGIQNNVNEYSGDIVLTNMFPGQNVDGYQLGIGYAPMRLYNNNIFTTCTGHNFDAADIGCFAVDIDAGKAWAGYYDDSGAIRYWFDSSGGTTGNPVTGANPTWTFTLKDFVVPAFSVYQAYDSRINFGQYAWDGGGLPQGFKAICTENLPEPTIIEGNEGADAVMYVGDAQSPRDISLNFQPDFVWIKNRTDVAPVSHVVFDSVRGVNKNLIPNTDDDEQDSYARGYLSAFLSNGFTVQAGSTDKLRVNDLTEDMGAWCLKKGAKFGFDIITFTGDGVAGRTIAHSLGAPPELIIGKNLGGTNRSWRIYHHHAQNKIDPETDIGVLDTNAAWADSTGAAGFLNDTAPGASVITVGNVNWNTNLIEYVLYLFRSIPGFSHVFSYEGNGSANGPYVYLGFKPRFIILKNADGTNSWRLYDTARNPYNGQNVKYVLPDQNVVEGNDGANLYFNANGFKFFVHGNAWNTNNDTIVGIAFAEVPFKYANAQ